MGNGNSRGFQAFGGEGLSERTGLDKWVQLVDWLIERLNVKRAMDQFLRTVPHRGPKRERGVGQVSKGKFLGL